MFKMDWLAFYGSNFLVDDFILTKYSDLEYLNYQLYESTFDLSGDMT